MTVQCGRLPQMGSFQLEVHITWREIEIEEKNESHLVVMLIKESGNGYGT